MDRDDLPSALEILGVSLPADQDSLKALLLRIDTDRDGLISIDEFLLAINLPSAIESWSKAIPWHKIIADSFPRKEKEENLRLLTQFSSQELDFICDEILYGIKRELFVQVANLRVSFEAMDRNAKGNNDSSKFKTFKASCGSVKDFHQGLGSRVGELAMSILRTIIPFCLNFFRIHFFESVSPVSTGQPHTKLLPAMKAEHCSKAGFDFQHTSKNYGITTSPEREWKVVVEGLACAAKELKHGRVVRTLTEYSKDPLVESARLSQEEVISVVNYTGPLVCLAFGECRDFTVCVVVLCCALLQ
jgi:Ca2+-binding EF-hand superfamily protein